MERNQVFPPATKEAWRALVERDPKMAPVDEKLVTPLEDGIVAQPLYTRADRPAASRQGVPGAAPWIRGTQARPRPWEVRQIVDGPSLEEAAVQARTEVERGATALLLRVGEEGVELSSADELARVLEGISLDGLSVELDAGADFARAAAWLEPTFARRPDASGSFGADPIGVAARTGRAIEPLLDQLVPVARTALRFPRVRAVRASAAPYHDAGATAAQEMSAVLSAAVAYLSRLVDGGLSVDEAARLLAIELPIGPDVFWEIARLRAMRWIWGRALRAAGAQVAPRIEAVTSWRMMTARDPWVNLLRTTAAAFSAAVGGAESLTVLPFDAAVGRSDGFARRLARNVQRILLDETQLHHVIDPAGGAFYLEALTDELARKAWAAFQSLEAEGGIVEALHRGSLQRAIAEAAAEREKRVARRKLPITGVSEFPLLDEAVLDRAPRAAAKLPAKTAIEPLRPRRLAASFEALRHASDAHRAATGARPRVFLANLGALAEYNARSTWIRNLLAAGGIEAVGDEGFSSGPAAAEAFARSGCEVAVICGADRTYESLAEEAARALRGAGAARVLLAGRPGELEGRLREAGVEGFLYLGQDAIEALTSLLASCGVSVAEDRR